MGYLVCGPIGCGKTFLVSCFSNEVGIPMVRLKNFRSQWQGVTEGNLEKILTILTALSPIIVMIDEADAYLGDRKTQGDSGVSTRVFSQIVSFMGNTLHRGKIIWFLMTARPDLMPVDLKRQGRAEEHLALFLPMTKQERIDLFYAMAKKTNATLATTNVPSAIEKGTKSLSGADMEAILTRAKMMAFHHGYTELSIHLLNEVIDDFIPPTYPEEIELQTLYAILECTSKQLLPEVYRNMQRGTIIRRIKAIEKKLS